MATIRCARGTRAASRSAVHGACGSIRAVITQIMCIRRVGYRQRATSQLPPSIGVGTTDNDRAGWLRFGRPAIKTEPPLAADHFVKPEPGLLVLFPAYMWHGVEPFESDRARLSVAFDVVPA